MVDFSSSKVLLRNFLLLAFAFIDGPTVDKEKNRTYDLVGVSEDNHRMLLGFKAKVGEDGYEDHPKIKYTHKSDIHLVIPCAFLRESKSMSYLLVCRGGSGFTNHIYFPPEADEEEKILNIGSSTSIPLLYADPETLQPLLLIQRSGKVESVRIETKENFDAVTMPSKYGPLSSNHSSAFVDVVGDLKADLALMVGEGSSRKLRILRNLPTGFEQVHELGLPRAMGPMMFGDFRKTGMNDLAFVYTNSRGKAALRVYYNNNTRECIQMVNKTHFSTSNKFNEKIYTEDNVFEKELEDLGIKYAPVFDTGGSYGSIPCGTFVADLHANNKLLFFLTMKEEGSWRAGERKLICAIRPVVKGGRIEDLEIPKSLEGISNIRGTFSVTCADYNNTGREAILINYITEDKMVLASFKNDLSKENLKLSLTSILPTSAKRRKCYGCVTQGASYLALYSVYEKTSIIGSQMSQSSFLHLRHSTAFLGLSQNNYIVDNLVIGTPGRGEKLDSLYTISSAVIPNTDLVFYLGEKGKCFVESHFIIGPHTKKILMVLLTVGLVNLIVVLLFQSRDRMKRTRSRSADNMHPLFSTLT
jgi:integrin alpha FG-GAP repeat containing protein 1